MSDLFAQEISEDGWTLTTRFGEIITTAQEKYGKRNFDYTILGVEFRHNGPYNWHMELGDKLVVIVLSNNCLSNKDRALYQLAHEAVHCLAPIRVEDCTVLEEGTATVFQEWYSKRMSRIPFHAGQDNYKSARDKVQELLDVDEDIIKKLRKDTGKSFSKIKPKEIIKMSDGKIKKKLADELCSPFNYEG